MAKSKKVHTNIDGRSVTISNLAKIIYPTAAISKAEIIKYYVSIASLFIKHGGLRPITMIRYPDGIEGKRFYSKNLPDWRPDWLRTIEFEDDDNIYALAHDKASMAWLANLVALELHPMNFRAHHSRCPDQMIFDLDPSEEISFEVLKGIALLLKTHIETFGYTPYIKTSGSKGLHIYVPIRSHYSIDEVYEAIHDVAKSFVKAHQDTVTLSISKERRKSKVLIDILRNRSHNSCVAAYSLRAKYNAPVSMPFRWSELDGVKDSQHWNINNCHSYLDEYGDAWADIWENAVELHTHRSVQSVSEYDEKRDFQKTEEPTFDDEIQTSGHDFVIQLHNASNLHLDLRLEMNGVLRSWALPKGLPSDTSTKRLAIQTEDHPLKYLAFEGTIPKSEYGGGEMWILNRGEYEMIKQSERSYKFVLKGTNWRGEYLLYNTSDKQWIIENSGVAINMDLHSTPMLAAMGSGIPSGDMHFYEIKWDGLRTTIVKEDDTVTIYSRSGNDITSQFPELEILKKTIVADSAIIDGEIVYLNEAGKPEFSTIVGRIHVKSEDKIKSIARTKPATFIPFDMTYVNGYSCLGDTNVNRRRWLKGILKKNVRCRFSQGYTDGKALFEGVKLQGMEGIIAKRKEGKYIGGKRNDNWLKIKVRHEATPYVIGYVLGDGDRTGKIGSLQLALPDGDTWIYKGRVGTGFTLAMLDDIQAQLDEYIDKDIYRIKVQEAGSTVWLKPKFACEISYASLTPNATYREPVFKRLVDVKDTE